MTASHIHRMFFASRSLRSAQSRLRLLWEHGYLNRCFITESSGGAEILSAKSRQPVYHLSKLGRCYLEKQEQKYLNFGVRGIPYRSVGVAALDHHLLTTDFLVSLCLALKEEDGIALQEAVGEAVLWRRLAVWKKGHRREKTLVPDGGFTLCYPGNGEPCSFFLEIVRSGVKGGNRQLLKKLSDYVKLHHQGFFREAYGSYRLRAVVIVTSTRTRAEHFRALAQTLPYGRGLFWFGTYQAEKEKAEENRAGGENALRNTLTAESILDSRFQDVAGAWRSLKEPEHLERSLQTL